MHYTPGLSGAQSRAIIQIRQAKVVSNAIIG